MSIHKSLVARSRLKRQRNVLTRTERILKLEEEGKWSQEDSSSVFSLPKVRVAKLKKTHAKKKAKEEDAEGEGGDVGEQAPVESASR